MELPRDTHVLLCAYPEMGHLIPMASLARHLAARGCRVTYCTAKNAAEDLLKLWPIQKGSVADPSELRLRLVGLGEDVPKEGHTAEARLWKQTVALSSNILFGLQYMLEGGPLPDLATELELTWPPPTVAICTMIATVPTEACLNAGLKTLLLFDTNAYGFVEISRWANEEPSRAEWRGAASEATAYTVTHAHLAAAPPATLPLREHFSKLMCAALTWAVRNAAKCHGILINSSEALEPLEFAQAYRVFGGEIPVKAVGPLLAPADGAGRAQALQPEVREVLNSAAEGEVLYVSFGSFMNPPQGHLALLAAALRQRRKPFVWSLRDRDRVLEPGYEASVKGFGVVVPWVDQKALLVEPAIGWMLSHMGWNSFLETMTAGKALIGWPLGFDQLCNSDLLLSYGLGLRVPLSLVFSPSPSPDYTPAQLLSSITATLGMLDEPQAVEAKARAAEVGAKLRAGIQPEGDAQRALGWLAEYIAVGVAPTVEEKAPDDAVAIREVEALQKAIEAPDGSNSVPVPRQAVVST